MKEEQKLLEETIQLLLLKYPNFGSNIANTSFEFNEHLKYHTAATDGKKIYIDPNYLKTLNENDRLFLIAHELMHNKFLHPFRLEYNKKKRNLDVWNEATDAIINANLERDGFKIKQGYVNIPDALNYSANELYEILIKEKKNQSNEKEFAGSDHSLWEDAFVKAKEQLDYNFEFEEIKENQEFSENRQERLQKAKQNYKQMKERVLKKKEEKSSSMVLGNVGESEKTINWELLLRKESEKEETFWSHRRSIAENNYAYRLEETDLEEECETEVQIDISGSVSLELVKAFLRIVKNIFSYSKLKVGCFNEKFWGWKEIKSTKDIDNFEIPENSSHFAWTQDWDLAVRSFTAKKEINKIVFTDGIIGFGNMPKEDLKNENIIWIVYGNKNFSPCCGKVIQISEKDLKRLNTTHEDSLGKSR